MALSRRQQRKSDTYVSELELSDRPLGQDRLRHHLKSEVADRDRLVVERPVVVALDLSCRKVAQL